MSCKQFLALHFTLRVTFSHGPQLQSCRLCVSTLLSQGLSLAAHTGLLMSMPQGAWLCDLRLSMLQS